MFNAFAAPQMFATVLEYPLAMIIVALLRPPRTLRDGTSKTINWSDLTLPLFLGAGTAGLIVYLQSNSVVPARLIHVLIFGLSGIVCLSFAKHSVRFALGLSVLMIASLSYTGPYGRVLKAERSFFGVYRVMLDRSENYHLLLHGTTIHGMQSLAPTRRLEPLTYYYATGPIGQVFKLNSKPDRGFPVAIVGLGTGSLACYGKAGQTFTFYEIDPVVEAIARDPRYFSYLADCPAQTTVVLGDARISLKNAPERHYGLIVLDAFSSDAIPIHLLTKEAVELYLSKLAARGLLAFHISNRHFDLAQVLGDLAREIGLVAIMQNDLAISELDNRNGKEPSRWVVLARQRKDLASLLSDSRWQLLQVQSAKRAWRDDFSNIVEVLKLN
jgi:hypothetical protein